MSELRRKTPFPRRIVRWLGRSFRQFLKRRWDHRRPTFSQDESSPLTVRLSAPTGALLAQSEVDLSLYAERVLEHRFDLLGSGWSEVAYGVRCPGMGPWRYHRPGIAPTVHGRGLERVVTPTNISRSREIWSHIKHPYRPIDWQLDFKSGYRWSSKTWYMDIEVGYPPGADVKVPWELGRLQHLPRMALALAAKLSSSKCESGEAERILDEIRNQLLDFIATNPPRFGVQWRSTMDVAIRAVNILVAWDLIRACGAELGAEIDEIVSRSVREHGRHIVENFQRYDFGRGNHFLSHVAGLAFVSVYLPSSRETDAWLALAIQEFTCEVGLQFHVDGSNFEGSTSYHRLSTEIAVFTTALLLGLPEERLAAPVLKTLGSAPLPAELHPFGLERWETGALVPAECLRRLHNAAAFTAAAQRPDGLVPQFGDNDSGRFLKLALTRESDSSSSGPCEMVQDHRLLISAAGALPLSESGGSGHSDPDTIDAFVVAAFMGEDPLRRLDHGRPIPVPTVVHPATSTKDLPPEEVSWSVRLESECDLLDGITYRSFTAFGLYIFRSSGLYLAIRCGPLGRSGFGGTAIMINFRWKWSLTERTSFGIRVLFSIPPGPNSETDTALTSPTMRSIRRMVQSLRGSREGSLRSSGILPHSVLNFPNGLSRVHITGSADGSYPAKSKSLRGPS